MDRAIESELSLELEQLAQRGRRRVLAPLEGASRAVDFTTNDYLGLARHPEVIEAGARALREFGAGARASRLLGGGTALDAEAEEHLAEWIGAQAALLFPTGFQANLGLVATLAHKGDHVFSDASIHASLVDACRLSRAETRIFRHNDLEHLAQLLANCPGTGRRIILTEGIFSMSGERAPLEDLQRLCEDHDAWLVVDEAHAVGLVGPRGAGAWAEVAQGLEQESRLLARMVTGGKALGAAGGFVAGSTELREILLQSARSFIFTTGASPAVSGALVASIRLARDAEDDRRKLQALGTLLAGSLDLPQPAAAIVPFTVGENSRALEVSETLRAGGLEVRAVRPPTVPEGQAGLRVVLHSFNDPEDVARLLEHLSVVDRTPGPVRSAKSSKRPIFVVGTDTDIGKTVVSAVLLRALARRTTPTYWKPVQTGEDSDTQTVRGLTRDCGAVLAEPLYSFPLPASPHEAAAAAESEIATGALEKELAAKLEGTQEGELLVELAGGLLVPYDDEHTQLDWLAARRPRIVLVARSGLGTLNHTLLSLQALTSKGLSAEALFLVGEPHPSNRETLARMTGVPHIFELPILDPLTAATLDQWIDSQTQPLP